MPALDADAVVEHLGDRRQAIRRARCIGNDAVLAGQFVVVDAIDDGQIGALGRGRDQHPFGAGVEMLLATVAVGEEAGAFQRDVDPVGGMGQLAGIALGGDGNALAINNQVIPVCTHIAGETPMHAVARKQPGI
jgi:hypothetical protein